MGSLFANVSRGRRIASYQHQSTCFLPVTEYRPTNVCIHLLVVYLYEITVSQHFYTFVLNLHVITP